MHTHNHLNVIVWGCQFRYQLFSSADLTYPIAQRHIFLASLSSCYFSFKYVLSLLSVHSCCWRASSPSLLRLISFSSPISLSVSEWSLATTMYLDLPCSCSGQMVRNYKCPSSLQAKTLWIRFHTSHIVCQNKIFLYFNQLSILEIMAIVLSVNTILSLFRH